MTQATNLHIFALVTDAFQRGGGIAQYNRDFLSALALVSQVQQVTILPRYGDEKQQLSIKKINQLKAKPNKLYYIWAVFITTLKQRKSINTIFCGHLYMMPIAIMLGYWLRCPVWLQLHGIDAWRCPNRLVRWAAEKATLVTVVSRYTRQQFLSWANQKTHQVCVLPNTFTQPKITNAPVTCNYPIILTVGRLSCAEQYKGHDRVISCLPILLKHHPDLMYWIVGEGDDSQRLQALAESLHVEKSVRFLGKVDNEQLQQYYQQANLFVMPSLGEGFGIVFLEAMIVGTPALGFGLDGSIDALQDGNLGIVSNKKYLCADILQHLFDKSNDTLLVDKVLNVFGIDLFHQQVDALVKKIILRNNK